MPRQPCQGLGLGGGRSGGFATRHRGIGAARLNDLRAGGHVTTIHDRIYVVRHTGDRWGLIDSVAR